MTSGIVVRCGQIRSSSARAGRCLWVSEFSEQRENVARPGEGRGRCVAAEVGYLGHLLGVHGRCCAVDARRCTSYNVRASHGISDGASHWGYQPRLLTYPGSPRRLRPTMTAISINALTANAASTKQNAAGADVNATAIAPPLHISAPKMARTKRSVNALSAGEAPAIPAVGSW